MPIEVKIVGEDGRVAKVNGENQFEVVVHPHPPKGEGIVSIPFRTFFTNDAGSSNGRNNVND